MESGELASCQDGSAAAKRLAEIASAAGKVDLVPELLSPMPQVERVLDVPVDKPRVERRISCPKFDTAPAKLLELTRSTTGSSDPNAIAISSLVRSAIGGTPAHKSILGLGKGHIEQPGLPKTLEPSSAATALSPKPGPKGGGRLNAGAFGSAPARGSRPRPAAPAPAPAAPSEPATPAAPSSAVPITGVLGVEPVAAPHVAPATSPTAVLAAAPVVPQPKRRLDQPVTDSDRRLILSKFASAPTRGRDAPRRQGKAHRLSMPAHQEADHGQSDDEGGRVDRPVDRPAVLRKALDTQSSVCSEDVHGEGMSDLSEETPQATVGEHGPLLDVMCEEKGT